MVDKMKDHPLCSVIIVTYNGKDLLKRFLPSIVAQDYPNYEVIIVDNASSDGTAKFVKENYPNFRIVACDENYGTAEGSNTGAKHCKGEYILWLSNDMELEPDFIRLLVERSESDPKIGICTCKMRRWDTNNNKTNIIDSVGGNIDIFGFPDARGINQVDNGQLNGFGEVFFSFGGAMLIKREVFEKTGGYDRCYFTLGDDIDLSWRTWLLGYKVTAEPGAVLYHRVSATLGTLFGRSQKRFWSERNTLRSILKNYSFYNLIMVLPGYFSLSLAEMTFFLALGKTQLTIAEIRAITWNIKNLADTLEQREHIQHTRVIGDGEIKKRMLKRPQKIEVFRYYLKNRHTEEWKRYFGEFKIT